MTQTTLLYMIEEYRKNNNCLRQRIDELEIHVEYLAKQIADYVKAMYKQAENILGYPDKTPELESTWGGIIRFIK